MDADIAQSVERILGKDEVSGSNPDISSINEKGEDASLRLFHLLFIKFLKKMIYNSVFCR